MLFSPSGMNSTLWTKGEINVLNKPLLLVCFVFQIEFPRELDSIVYSCVDMQVNKMKLGKNGSLHTH